MRHAQTKPHSSKSNVGSGSGAKVTSITQKSSGSKRIQNEPIKSCKKRKLGSGGNWRGRSLSAQKHNKESDTEKTQKKYNPGVVKKSCVKVKRLKKPNEKFKKVNKKVKPVPKVVKRCKVFEKTEDNDGPPTLCETFSRITTMVAETVINEKEHQKLTESLLGKGKKEPESSSFSKGKSEGNGGDWARVKKGVIDTVSSKIKKEVGLKKPEPAKKVKTMSPKSKIAKMKSEMKKPKVSAKKLTEKATLDNSENLIKVLKDEEIPLAFGKGIGTRRKSTAGSLEGELKQEPPESIKGKCGNTGKAGKDAESQKKLQKPMGKCLKKNQIVMRKYQKQKAGEQLAATKKIAEEVKKSLEKEKEDQDPDPKESIVKKTNVKKETGKTKPVPNKKEGKVSQASNKKKLPTKEVKSPKPKFGSETDGSNSDELTLNIIQKKTKKFKTESDRGEGSGKTVKIEINDEETKVISEEKSSESEKVPSKAKKIKMEKEDKIEVSADKKSVEFSKEKKKGKDTESDTDEDYELRRILAKKLGRSMKAPTDLKKKKVENPKSGNDTEQRARRLRLFGFWTGPKRHRVASLNALAKVHCLYENESKGVLAEIEKMGQIIKPDEKKGDRKDEKKTEKKNSGKKLGKDAEMEKLDSVVINKRTLRGTPGTRGAGKHWDMFAGESTSTSSASSDESHSDTDRSKERKLPLQPSYRQKMQKKEDVEKEEAPKAPKRRRNTEIGVTMDLKDMVVRKRMASLNASAILAASYSSEKRSNRKDSSGTSTEDGMSSVDDNDQFLSADEGENSSGKAVVKKSEEKPLEEKAKEESASDSEKYARYKHKKHFWKTKVESLKKSSKEKRNSPSPILAEFGVGKDLSTTVLEKEKNDERNDDMEKDKKVLKMGFPSKKYTDARLKLKGKTIDGKLKYVKSSEKEFLGGKDDSKSKRKYSKRKFGEDDMKNINIEKMGGSEKTDEYEYKSDSDNGQRKLIELRNTGGSNKKVAVIVNQDTDVTITGVYVNSTRSTHHEGFCSIAGMQYRISSTSHTQTEATAVLKTSTASEQTPPPTEPTNRTSPRSHKTYTPLSALSNMQPPAGAPPHPHLPPPPHHHHHLCGMGQHRPPPDHYLGHGPISHQRPISPLARRHGCSSAFSAPHCSSQSAPGGPSSPARDPEGFASSLPSHGYFQPAGPLIHHHSSNPASSKAQNLSTLESGSAAESQPLQASGSEEAGETEPPTRSGDNPPPPPPPTATHHVGYPRGYPPYQTGYYQGSYYPPPPQSAHYQPPPPPPPPTFHQHYHHHQDLCYPPGYPPSSYPPPPGSYRRFLQPPPTYYSPELTYGGPSGHPPPQDHGSQQMVVPGGPSSSYSAPLDPYPPPTTYYPGYSTGPGPACYNHTPSSRNLTFIGQSYQNCPCPMQLCPKNVHIGPLTGECKRPSALPLPPVALQLPQEPPGAAGPPSPARGSAGMPPQPSPASNSARPNFGGPTWDGRPIKSSSEIKWEESKTLDLESKPPHKCKTEVLNYPDSKEIWDLSSRKSSYTTTTGREKSANAVENQWNNAKDDKREVDTDNVVQGLLAISSKEITRLTFRTQKKESDPVELDDGNGGKKIKRESLTTPPMEMVESSGTSKKRSSSAKPTKRKKSEDVVEDTAEESKKRKKKADPEDENCENKLRKVKKNLMSNKKDENACANQKLSRKNLNSKAKLLKDRNETVLKGEDSVTKIIEHVIKGPCKKETVEEDPSKTDKIAGRRKSNQERSGVFPEAAEQQKSVRKSKSCSPSRSKAEEARSLATGIRKEEKRREGNAMAALATITVTVTKNGKKKPEVKIKAINEQHSKGSGRTGKRQSKPGKQQITILNSRQSQNQSGFGKSKKSKSGIPLSVAVLKKSALKKAGSSSGSPRLGIVPKWSNGWSWDSESFDAKVYLTNDEPPVMRKCYAAMRHVGGDVIHPKDCILLKAGTRRIDLPFVAKVAALWENPEDGEMMVSLLWYYRPEHTDQGRQPSDHQDEIFASRHKDINSVACIEDKCFVLTYNEYCRYRKKVRKIEEGVAETNVPVPRLEQPYFRIQKQPPGVMAPDLVFFCKRVYDFRQKRLLKNPT